jgi:DNA-binding GntR family transcriptional regulator
MPPVASKTRHAEPASFGSGRPEKGEATGKIVRQTTVELVTAAIRERILSGSIAPGEPLRQEALADELGVSRVPIREAITRLSGEGLLNVVPHKGAYVCELSVDEVRETYDIRIRLEPWIFSEAIRRITDAEISKAARLAKAMDQGDDSQWGPLGWEFHSTLYKPAKREITLETLRVLHDRSGRYFRYQLARASSRKQSYIEHMLLVDACVKHDSKLGARLLKEHLEKASDQLAAMVESIVAA